MSLIDSSVIRLLKEKFELGLFENPYVDIVAANKSLTTKSSGNARH